MGVFYYRLFLGSAVFKFFFFFLGIQVSDHHLIVE